MPDVQSFQLQQEFLIVGAAAKSGMFETLEDKPQTVEELAAGTGCDPRAIWTVAEALVTLGYLEHADNKLKLTGEAYAILFDQNSEQYTGFSFMHSYNLYSAWLQLPEVLKTGQPAKKMDGAGISKDFIVAMSHFAKKAAPEIVDYCLQGLPPGTRVLDVGGGPLTLAIEFAQKGAVVTVLDLPDVIDMMQPELDPALPISMVKGDFTTGLPRGPFDLVYLGNVCHIYGEKENRKLFTAAANELERGGRLIINDMIRGTGGFASIFAVNMLINTESGGTWTYEQYQTWLQDAGFAVAPFAEVGGRQLITATKQ